jgi:predicted Zn-dependent peptidase
VRGFSRADLETFVAEHYGPDQMILAAAGAVDHDALVARPSGSSVSCRRRGSVRRARRISPAASGAVKPLEQVHYRAGFEGPGYRDPTHLYRADLCHRAGRRHVLAAVPGNPRTPRAVLHDLRAGPGPMPTPA